MAVIQQFRTAVRGFNRQDVQDYIEQMAAVHRQELGELQKRLEKSDRRIEELEEIVTGMEAVEEESSRTREALDAANQTVSRLRGELSQADAKLTVAKKEMERLQARVETLEPMADSYQKIRDRAANVELEAHQKAQAEMSRAKTEGEQVRADTRRWLNCVLAEYSQLRAGLDGVLEQMKRLTSTPEKLEELDETARQLRERGGLK